MANCEEGYDKRTWREGTLKEIFMHLIKCHYFFSYVYWTVHHLDSWGKRDQLDVTCFIVSLFNAQHVSDVNTSETCWVLNKEIIKHVTSSWCLFPQLSLFLCMCPISCNNFQTDWKRYEFHNTGYILCTSHFVFNFSSVIVHVTRGCRESTKKFYLRDTFYICGFWYSCFTNV